MNLVQLKQKIDSIYEMADNPELIEVIIKKNDPELKKSEIAIDSLDFIFGDRVKLRINPKEDI
jgi:hypothetical protein